MAEREFLGLFEGFGVELEYAIVENDSLSVLPLADEVIRAAAGAVVSEVEQGEIAWSNELVLHVIELKTNGPAPRLQGLAEKFQANVRRINDILREHSGRLMPTAMHPWMDPASETRLWPHEHSPVYEAFDKVFDCRGHGWSNLQSLHINLPFKDAEEFGRLHAAMRLLLPILPGLAASSPIVDGRPARFLDYRMEAYRSNSIRIPSVAGEVVPEPVFTPADYRREVLERMYRDIAPYDPGGILQEEFLNARGAMPHFDRQSIEVRVLDVQECPRADLAVAHATVEVLRALVEERWSTFEEQKAWSVEPLAALLYRAIRDGEEAVIEEPEYARAFGLEGRRLRVQDLWRHLAGEVLPAGREGSAEWRAALDRILEEGPLARRILKATGPRPTRERLREVYGSLCECLACGELFVP